MERRFKFNVAVLSRGSSETGQTQVVVPEYLSPNWLGERYLVPFRSDLVGKSKAKYSVLAPSANFYLKAVEWQKSRRDRRKNTALDLRKS